MSFDDAFTADARSPRLRTLFTTVFDDTLPPEVEPFSFVPVDGMRLIAERLGLSAGERLLDLACGRGGPGMWIARETGAQLVGVDFSKVAIEHAEQRRALFGLEERAEFKLGEFGALAAAGIADESVDGVMCVDAVQFAPDLPAALADILRVLRPGRRLALTNWSGPRGDGRFPPDLGGQLTAAGFTDVEVTEHPDWLERQRLVLEAALAIDPAEIDGDVALVNIRGEAERVIADLPGQRRLLVSGAKPLSR